MNFGRYEKNSKLFGVAWSSIHKLYLMKELFLKLFSNPLMILLKKTATHSETRSCD